MVLVEAPIACLVEHRYNLFELGVQALTKPDGRLLAPRTICESRVILLVTAWNGRLIMTACERLNIEDFPLMI